jgi:hypothetical protein
MLIPHSEAGAKAIVLLYDPGDGRIVHGYYYEVDAGGKLPDQATLEKAAHDAAALHAKPADKPLLPKLATLHADPKSFDLRKAYRVDPAKRVPIEVKPA